MNWYLKKCELYEKIYLLNWEDVNELRRELRLYYYKSLLIILEKCDINL